VRRNRVEGNALELLRAELSGGIGSVIGEGLAIGVTA